MSFAGPLRHVTAGQRGNDKVFTTVRTYPVPYMGNVKEVFFKPKGVPPGEASEIRSVEISCDRPRSEREETYRVALRKAVDDGVLTRYAAYNHWEPFRVEVKVGAA